ncbi:MAG: histidine phosphatase family protein [Anaerotruncus sp.]|nr:histidine phosphatase family protein [Anaerotruncus sp.]
MTTVFLIRHGTTESNLKGLFQGSLDIPLNDLGLAQAQCLAKRFRDTTIEAVYTSPLSRARQTAECLCQLHSGLQPVVCEGLREICGGVLEGKTGTQNRLTYPEEIRCMKECPAFFHPPGGESTRLVYDRMRDTMQGIVAQNPGRTIAVVSHGFTIQTYLGYVKRVPFPEIEPYIVGNASVTTLCYLEDGEIVLKQQSDESHLPPALQFYVATNFL